MSDLFRSQGKLGRNDSTSHSSPKLVLLHSLGVLREEVVSIGRIGDFDLHDPCPVRVGVDLLGRCGEIIVDRSDLAGDGRIQIGDGLDRFDAAEDFALLDRGTDLGQIDEDDVAEGVLRVVGDADLALLTVELDPFVFFGVFVGRRDSPYVAVRPL